MTQTRITVRRFRRGVRATAARSPPSVLGASVGDRCRARMLGAEGLCATDSETGFDSWTVVRLLMMRTLVIVVALLITACGDESMCLVKHGVCNLQCCDPNCLPGPPSLCDLAGYVCIINDGGLRCTCQKPYWVCNNEQPVDMSVPLDSTLRRDLAPYD
jgi:hypothetical protein